MKIYLKNFRKFVKRIRFQNFSYNVIETKFKFLSINKKLFSINFSSNSSNELQKLIKSDLNVNLKWIKKISNTNSSFISNSENLDEVFLNIRNNLYQLEYDIENNLNEFLHTLLCIIINSSIIQIQNLKQNENLKIILKKILNAEYMNYYDNKSFLSILVILNLKLVKNEELKFLIQHGISEDFKLLKILKYGQNLLKLNFRKNLIRQLFVKYSQIDNSKFPKQIIIEDNLLEYLIYAKSLDINRIDDFQFYIEKLFIKLEKELHKKDEEIKVNREEIFKRLLVLKTCIDHLHLKKENPNVKLLSDILLAYIRQYKDHLDLDHFILLYSIISSDKFLTHYDIKLFKDKFEQDLFIKLEDNFNQVETFETRNNFIEFKFHFLVELFYYLDKLYSFDDLYFVKISQMILSKLKIWGKLVNKDCELILEMIEIYLNNSCDLFNRLQFNIPEYRNLENFKTFVNDLIKYDQYKDCLVEKIKNLLKFKIYFQLEKKRNVKNSKFLYQLNTMVEKDQLINLTKNCMEVTYYIEKNLK